MPAVRLALGRLGTAGGVACLLLAHSAFALGGDDPGDREALTDFGRAMDFAGWKKKGGWLSSQSVCSWEGVGCTGGRVTSLVLVSNRLQGDWSVLSSFGRLTKLKTLQLDGTQPPSYSGCVDSNFSYSDFPDSFWSLPEMETFSAENACLGGTLRDGPAGVGGWRALKEFSIHQNRVSGPFPFGFNNASQLQVLKLDRNPISGTVPLFTGWGSSLQKFCCNFCALSGPFPSMDFSRLTGLVEMYWDGNAFTSLPSGLGDAPNLRELSFNINSITGPFPAALCGLKSLTDCRVGADTNCSANNYAGCYPWLQNVTGNLYNCPLPSSCDVCNKSTSPLACGGA
jgi:hypothetical protein